MTAKRDDLASTWEQLLTEGSLAVPDLDLLPPSEVVRLLIEEDRRGLERALEHREELSNVAAWFAEAYAQGGRVLFVGAGTSGRLGVLEAAECPPTFGTDAERILAAIAGGPEAVFRAVEGAEDSFEDGVVVGSSLQVGDLLIGISASSVTAFVRGALEGAKRQGARTVLLTCVPAVQVKVPADRVVALGTGAEVLAGSTRLKAGSVTKAALNAITTTAMVMLGKVYGRWMVDLRPGSAKLLDRAERILMEVTGVDRDEARELLELAGCEVKVAIVIRRLRCRPDQAKELLAKHEGQLRAALAAAGDSGLKEDRTGGR